MANKFSGNMWSLKARVLSIIVVFRSKLLETFLGANSLSKGFFIWPGSYVFKHKKANI